MNATLRSRLARNQAFWNRSPVERPLLGLGVNITFPMLAFSHQIGNDLLTPDMLHPEDFFSEWDQAYLETEQRGEDLFSVASPLASVPWMEAMAGCRVRVVPGSGSMWVEHPDPADIDLRQIRFDPNNPWLRKLVEFSQALAEHAAGRYPVGNPILRGVSDLAAAMLGPTRMVYEFYDHPQWMHDLCERCTELWQGVAQELTRAKGSFHGGSCADRRRVWGKGSSLLYQDDAVVLTSPKIHADFFLPHTAEILRPYTNTIIHLHSNSLRVMQESLCELPEVKALEVLLDPAGPQGRELLGRFRQILKRKALVICGEMDFDLIQVFLTELPAAGLSLQPKVNNAQEASHLWGQIQLSGVQI